MAFLFHNGRYRCEELIGSGGYGRVYRAYDEHLGRFVALKLLTQGEPLAFATREAIALSALEGPYILRVLNADRHQDVPYLATEIVNGGSAQDRVLPYGVRPDFAVRWIRHMLIGLGVCHSRGLLHRDIKPGNVFLKSDDEALLGDFGVCAVMTAQGQADPAGTPEVRAPECWTSKTMTVRSDIYSAGLALYVLLTGRAPFSGSTENEVRDAVLARRHPRVRELAPHVPQRLAMRLERAMEADPSDRYQSARQFHRALGEAVVGQNVWLRHGAHQGHLRCWLTRTDISVKALTICVSQSTSGYIIETRQQGGDKRRVTPACGQAGSERQLGIFLRRVFDQLG